ncbi:MAG TPA: bifunctional phosphoribosylaminoimidazolecarboxamide formyltransferase/IMP cyclohydrolase, partial [Patescibacteria group bacterium]|nr:bifunctional phosphoribosylaminoimidazolecarboxamide formyltransferase/IMP cyclohydrolase [Patescibacteria group bacterium]
MGKIKTALISVSDKTGILEFAKFLSENGVEILSTGGTAKLLKENSLPVTMVSDYTGFPEMMDGRVKTLHPKIHGGLLGKRDDANHMKAMEEHGIKPIDMLVVNLYPFEATISKEDCSFEYAIENIDIGGPSMVRSAAKNHNDVAVVASSRCYEKLIQELSDNDFSLSKKTRLLLAQEAFAHTSRYDSLISEYLLGKSETNQSVFPENYHIPLKKVQDLRYGENPHQNAAFYIDARSGNADITEAQQLQGKELSFNNIIDLEAALKVVLEFKETASVIIKHTNPCGIGIDESLLESFKKAKETDPVSAFGGIIGFNRIVNASTAEEIVTTFVEAIIAPDYEKKALEIFSKKKNLRLMKLPMGEKKKNGESLDIKRVSGGLLLQNNDDIDLVESQLKVVTKKQPSEDQWEALRFAWKAAKHVKS